MNRLINAQSLKDLLADEGRVEYVAMNGRFAAVRWKDGSVSDAECPFGVWRLVSNNAEYCAGYACSIDCARATN